MKIKITEAQLKTLKENLIKEFHDDGYGGAGNDPRAPWNQNEPEYEGRYEIIDYGDNIDDIWVKLYFDDGGRANVQLYKILKNMGMEKYMDSWNNLINKGKEEFIPKLEDLLNDYALSSRYFDGADMEYDEPDYDDREHRWEESKDYKQLKESFDKIYPKLVKESIPTVDEDFSNINYKDPQFQGENGKVLSNIAYFVKSLPPNTPRIFKRYSEMGAELEDVLQVIAADGDTSIRSHEDFLTMMDYIDNNMDFFFKELGKKFKGIEAIIGN